MRGVYLAVSERKNRIPPLFGNAVSAVYFSQPMEMSQFFISSAH